MEGDGKYVHHVYVEQTSSKEELKLQETCTITIMRCIMVQPLGNCKLHM